MFFCCRQHALVTGRIGEFPTATWLAFLAGPCAHATRDDHCALSVGPLYLGVRLLHDPYRLYRRVTNATGRTTQVWTVCGQHHGLPSSVPYIGRPPRGWGAFSIRGGTDIGLKLPHSSVAALSTRRCPPPVEDLIHRRWTVARFATTGDATQPRVKKIMCNAVRVSADRRRSTWRAVCP
jgi:hypothetical protein